MGKKVSRRDFARASMAAGAAAAAIPSVLLGKEPAAAPPAAGAKAAGAAVAEKRRIARHLEVGYGGANSWGDGRDLLLAHTLTPAGQPTPNYPGGWKEGTTIPVEYYVDEKIYQHDEDFLAEHFWFMVDHHS